MNVREASALAAHVVNGKGGTLPILAYMRFSGGRIMASDLSQQIDIPLELPAGVRNADFCVHAGRFLRVLNALPPELELKLDHRSGKLHVEAGPTRYELTTLGGDDYPTIANDEAKAVQFGVQAKGFVHALSFTAKAMAKNDVRYYLNGIHFMLRNRRLTLTATDGHRLHRAWIDVADAELTDNAEGIIATQSVARLVEVAERHVDVSLEASPGRFNIVDHEVLSTKLIDGKFPDANRVIPADRPSTGGLPRAPFLAAVRRVAQILAGDKITGMRFAFSQEAVNLSAKNTDGDKASEVFQWNAADKRFAGVELGMDASYVAEAFDALTGDWAFAHLPQEPDQCLYLTDGGDHEVVIMPMRI
jgi:DNA polymerase-3 subunit beta